MIHPGGADVSPLRSASFMMAGAAEQLEGAVSKLRVILSEAKNLCRKVCENLQKKDPSSLRSSG